MSATSLASVAFGLAVALAPLLTLTSCEDAGDGEGEGEGEEGEGEGEGEDEEPVALGGECYRAVNETESPTFTAVCADGLDCVVDSFEGSVRGACREPANEGARCSLLAPPGEQAGDGCIDTLYCGREAILTTNFFFGPPTCVEAGVFGAPCNAADGCTRGTCLDDYCAPFECTVSADCGPGLVCVTEEVGGPRLCEAPTEVGDFCRIRSSDTIEPDFSHPCADGLSCVISDDDSDPNTIRSRCELEGSAGAPCITDDDCISNICFSDQCMPFECNVSADCGPGLVCATTLPSGAHECEPPIPQGFPCRVRDLDTGFDYSHPCAEGLVCVSSKPDSNGVCLLPSAVGGPCDFNGTGCEVDLVCEDLVCREP